LGGNNLHTFWLSGPPYRYWFTRGYLADRGQDSLPLGIMDRGGRASHHHLNIGIVALGSPLAAIAGSQFGYWLGWHYGIKEF
jgi:hypothetical protein